MALTRINNQALTNVTSAGIPVLSHDKMPSGSTVQVVQGTPVGGGNTSNRHVAISVPAYGNSRSNLRHIGSAYDISITSKLANSKFLVTGQVKVSGATTSHGYFDFNVKHGSTTQGWASDLIGGSGMTCDGLLAHHRTAHSDIFAEPISFLYEPDVAAGTVIKFEPYVGNWIATTVYLGGYSAASNNNSNSLNCFQITEIAG